MTNLIVRATLGYVLALIVACLLLAVFIVVAIAAEKKDYKDTQAVASEPGWIFCMNQANLRTPYCRMFLLDGPAPTIEAPK